MIFAQARASIRLPASEAQAAGMIRHPKYWVYDQFRRVVGDSWGTPDIGPDYQNYEFNNSYTPPRSVFNVNGNAGSIGVLGNPEFGPNDSGYSVVYIPISVLNAEFTAKITPVNVTGATFSAFFRYTPAPATPDEGLSFDVGTQYSWDFNYLTDTEISIDDWNGTTGANDSTTIPLQLSGLGGEDIYLKFKCSGTTLQMKMWGEGVPDNMEETDWQLTVVGTTTLAGGLALNINWNVDYTILPEGISDVQVKLLGLADLTQTEGLGRAQAAARINNPNTKLSAQAQALIHKRILHAQAQASINTVRKLSGQARAKINNPVQPQAGVVLIPMGGATTDAVDPSGNPVQAGINDAYRLDGYLQSEGLVSDMSIANFQAPYSDGSRSEYTGLTNKTLPITMRIVQPTWQQAKDAFETAATLLRIKRNDFMQLFLYYPDKYYEVLVRDISYDKVVEQSNHILDYTVDFEAKPWLTAISGHTYTGTGLVTTTGRTIENGGWTPTIVDVSGTNVVISGYTVRGAFVGYITISGTVTNLILDTELGTAKIGGESMIDVVNGDFSLYAGPEETIFDITGASNFTVTYHDRWYL